MAIMSIHHNASIAKEGGFTWFSRFARAIGERSRSSRRMFAADLTARALSHGLGPPLGKPRRNQAYAYFGGGVSRQPTEATTT